MVRPVAMTRPTPVQVTAPVPGPSEPTGPLASKILDIPSTKKIRDDQISRLPEAKQSEIGQLYFQAMKRYYSEKVIGMGHSRRLTLKKARNEKLQK